MKHLSKIFCIITTLSTSLIFTSQPEITIKPATLDDLDAISHLINQAYNETFKPLYGNLLDAMSLDQTLDEFINEKITKQNNAAVEFITKQLNQEEHACLVAYNITSETTKELV